MREPGKQDRDKKKILILTEPKWRQCKLCGMRIYGTESLCRVCRNKKPPIIYD